MPTSGEASFSTSSAAAQQQQQSQHPVFEFTRRKKWADIIISELPDTVLLILDTQHIVMYVGPAVPEVIGWYPEDLVDKDVLNIVNGKSAPLESPALNIYLM